MNTTSVEKIITLSRDLRWQIGDEFHDNLAEGIYADASEIAMGSVSSDNSKKRFRLDAKIDKIVTSKAWGFPIMILILGVVLWITIIGANYPSSMLADLLLENFHPFFKRPCCKYRHALVVGWFFNRWCLFGSSLGDCGNVAANGNIFSHVHPFRRFRIFTQSCF